MWETEDLRDADIKFNETRRAKDGPNLVKISFKCLFEYSSHDLDIKKKIFFNNYL